MSKNISVNKDKSN